MVIAAYENGIMRTYLLRQGAMKKDWVVWVGCVCLFLAGGVFFKLFSCTSSGFEYLNHNQGLAAWVQAVFSVIAILAAAYFPVAHEKARERRQRKDVHDTLLFIARPLREHLQRMKTCLDEHSWAPRWIMGDGPKELAIMGQSLKEIPASLMVGFELTLLASIRLAYSQAVEADALLHQFLGDRQQKFEDEIEHSEICGKMISELDRVIHALETRVTMV